MLRVALLAKECGRGRAGAAMRAGSLLIALLTSGCLASIDGGPPRLFPIAEEAAVARLRVIDNENAYYARTAQTVATRNEIITARMRAIDSYYYEFEAGLIRERQQLGFLSSIVSIGLSGAVPLVYAEGTKNILGAASSGLQGATKAFSDEVLFQKTVQVLATQMRARRDAVAAEIVKKMKALSIEEYPLPMALGDVDEYYASGSIAGALIEIQKTVSAKADDAEALKLEAIQVRFSAVTDLGKRIRAFWRSSPANKRLVEGWVENNTPFGSLPIFLRQNATPLYQRVIIELNIP
jgi:hypothetical protein